MMIQIKQNSGYILGREREREIDRYTNIQTDRQIDHRQTDRQMIVNKAELRLHSRQREREREIDIQTYRLIDRQIIDRQIDR